MSTNRVLKTAVFPVAGLGTRFLPVTKTGPKEMLAIVDQPIIQYAVQEAIAAGMTHLIFITSSEKRSIEDYFDRNIALEMWLEQQGKWDALQLVQNIIPSHIAISYVRQPIPLGLGHAIGCARHIVGEQPFAVILPDDLIDVPPNQKTCLERMVDMYQRTQSSIIAVEHVPLEVVDRYGMVGMASPDAADSARITSIVEKPPRAQTPSQWAVLGRYILTPTIFDFLGTTCKGVGSEIQLTDAIVTLLTKEAVYAHLLQGTRFDCGDKLGMVKATLHYALKKPEMKKALRSYLEECCNT